MPLTPSAIRNRRETVTFPYAGDSVTIEYYAANILDRLSQERLEALEAEAKATDDEYTAACLVADYVLGVVAAWDLVEDDGEPMPCTRERMARLILEDDGEDLLAQMLVALGEQVREKKQSGMPTPDASAATSSRTGATTSGQRAASRKRTKSR